MWLRLLNVIARVINSIHLTATQYIRGRSTTWIDQSPATRVGFFFSQPFLSRTGPITHRTLQFRHKHLEPVKDSRREQKDTKDGQRQDKRLKTRASQRV